jgi:hypothetical protein
MVTLRLPLPSSMLLVNLLGLAGLVGLAVSVGGLTHNWWWSLAVASTECVFLSVVAAQNRAEADEDELAVARSRVA